MFVSAEEVEVTGIVVQRWMRTLPGQRCHVNLALLANSVSHLQERMPQRLQAADDTEFFHQFWLSHARCPLKGRNKIVACICPQVEPVLYADLFVLIAMDGAF
jgi:DNA helicase MCM9